MTLPIIKAIQQHALALNPDTRFSLLSRPQYAELLEKLNIDGKKLLLPDKNWHYFFSCLKWRGHFDEHILFTNSERGDLEAWLMGAHTRYGIARPTKPRNLLTHKYTLDTGFDENTLHQTYLWRDFTQKFSLHNGQIDYSPHCSPQSSTINQIGLICGSANTPEKRWATKSWIDLINLLLEYGVDKVVLFGAEVDHEVCRQISANICDKRVENLAGKTTLNQLADKMCDQKVIIGNDTGGIHLANAVGVPVIGLYGLTNPIQSRPIHDGIIKIVESPKGFGEGSMHDIDAGSVFNTFLEVYANLH